MCKNSGFRSRIQKSYKKFGMESKNLIIFSGSIPNLLPPPLLPWAHTDRTDLTLSLHRELAKPNNYPKNNLK